jgi:hypothetical protein
MPPAKMQSLRIRDCRVICRGKVIDIRRSLTANHQTSSFYKNMGARCFKLHKLEGKKRKKITSIQQRMNFIGSVVYVYRLTA